MSLFNEAQQIILREYNDGAEAHWIDDCKTSDDVMVMMTECDSIVVGLIDAFSEVDTSQEAVKKVRDLNMELIVLETAFQNAWGTGGPAGGKPPTRINAAGKDPETYDDDDIKFADE